MNLIEKPEITQIEVEGTFQSLKNFLRFMCENSLIVFFLEKLKSFFRIFATLFEKTKIKGFIEKMEDSSPVSTVRVLKLNILYEKADNGISNCLHLLSYSIPRIFAIVIVGVVIYSLCTGIQQTTTSQPVKSFIRQLPLKLTTLFFSLRLEKFILAVIFKIPILYLLACFKKELATMLSLIVLFFIWFSFITKKQIILFDFKSLCFYNLLVHCATAFYMIEHRNGLPIYFTLVVEEIVLHSFSCFVSITVGFLLCKIFQFFSNQMPKKAKSA